MTKGLQEKSSKLEFPSKSPLIKPIPFDFGGFLLKSNYRQSDDPVPFAQ